MTSKIANPAHSDLDEFPMDDEPGQEELEEDSRTRPSGAPLPKSMVASLPGQAEDDVPEPKMRPAYEANMVYLTRILRIKAKKVWDPLMDRDRWGIVYTMEGKSLFALDPDNGFRQLCYNLIHNPFAEIFILSCIMFQAVLLMNEFPGGTHIFEEKTGNTVELIIVIIFTVEMFLRIISLGFCFGETTYMQYGWNILDFVLVMSAWTAMIIEQIGSTTEWVIKPSLFRCLRALRPLRTMRFFANLTNVWRFWPYVLNVTMFMLLFFSVFGAAGIDLFGGLMTYECVDWTTAHNATAVATLRAVKGDDLITCPDSIGCDVDLCLRIHAPIPTSDRREEIDYYGFDNIGTAYLTQFVITTLDDWPMIAHPLIDKHGLNESLVWPYFWSMTFVLGLIIGELYTSIVCYGWGVGDGDNTTEEHIWDRAKVKKMRAIFDRIDQDGSGDIATGEIVTIANLLRVNLTDIEVSIACQEMDSDMDGEINFREFCTWWSSDSNVSRTLKRAFLRDEATKRGYFDQCDLDDDGSLDQQEMVTLLKQSGIVLKDVELTMAWKEMDMDGNARIGFDEFSAWSMSNSSVAKKLFSASRKDTEKTKRMYRRFDANADGAIGEAELVANAGDLFHMPLTEKEGTEIFEEMGQVCGKDGMTQCSEAEFTKWFHSGSKWADVLRKTCLYIEADAREMFDIIDTSLNGEIDLEEFRSIADYLGLAWNSDDSKKIFEKINHDGSDQIEFQEFYTWLQEGDAAAQAITKAVHDMMNSKYFPYIPRVSDAFEVIVTNSMFEPFILVLVALNTACMAAEHHEMTTQLRTALDTFEICFTALYTIEAVMKIFGIGARPYFKDGLNQMDFSIVVISLLGLSYEGLRDAASFRIIRLLVKIMRVMRMIKILSRYDAIMILLKTVVGSSGILVSVGGFILFTLAICSIVAGQVMGTCHDPVTGTEHYKFGTEGFPRSNFYTFGDAMISNFQIMTGEDWAPLMYSYMHCSGYWSWVYFVLVFFLTNFVMLNVFVAVILENFDLEEHEKMIKQEVAFMDLHKTGIVGREVAEDVRFEDPDKESSFAVEWLKTMRKQGEKVSGENMRKLAGATTRFMKTNPDTESEGALLADVEDIDLDYGDENWNRTATDGEEFAEGDHALCIFSMDNPLRKLCIGISTHHGFDNFVLVLIMISALLLAVEGPPDAEYLVDEPEVRGFIITCNFVILLLFCAELVIKVVATGFTTPGKGYIHDSWNRLDFIVVVTSLIDLILVMFGETIKWTRVLRVLRVMRPLRMVKYNEGMRVVIDAVIMCAPTFTAAVCLTLVFYISFAILGVGMFAGKFHSCDCGGRFHELGKLRPCTQADNITHPPGSLDKEACLAQGGVWINPPYSFDNVFSAIKALFICSTTEGWIDIMHSGQDVTTIYQPPVRDAEWGNFTFFWAFIIVGSFFTNNIYIGILVNFFGESSGAALLTQKQKVWLQAQLLVLNTKSRVMPKPENSLRNVVYNFVENVVFEYAVAACIILNAAVMMAEQVPQDTALGSTFETINLVFLIIFTVEMALKIFGLGPEEYWSSHWNKFDAIIVAMSWTTQLVESSSALASFRSLRVIRILMLLKRFKTLRSLFTTLILSLPAAFNIALLFTLVLFVYAVVGMQLFGNIAHGEMITDNDNFDNIRCSMQVLYQISTGQDFMLLMHEYQQRGAIFVTGFFLSWVVVSIWVFLNLVVAVLLESFENNFIGEDMELQNWHVEHYKSAWVNLSDPKSAPDYEYIKASQIEELVPLLEGPLAAIVDLDPHWRNRIFFELGIELSTMENTDVEFHELLIVLCLINETYNGLSFEEQQARREAMAEAQRNLAARVVQIQVRFFLLKHRAKKRLSAPEQEGELRTYLLHIRAINLMLLDSLIRCHKTHRARTLV